MKKQLIIFLVSAIAIPALAQNTNTYHKRSRRTEQQRKQHQEQKYKFMDRILTRIGVSDEEKIKIRELQAEHRIKIETNKKRMEIAHVKLAWIQETDATDAEIDAAIQEVADAQTEQLKILVYNRRDMEKIIGKEKHAQLMEIARTQFHKRDRRSGSGLPPRPRLPPIPPQGHGEKEPPLPNAQGDQTPPTPLEN